MFQMLQCRPLFPIQHHKHVHSYNIVIVSGAFGNRFKQIAETYYKNVHVYDVEWGKAVEQ
jgi:aspartate aminotransferase-like enzyme